MTTEQRLTEHCRLINEKLRLKARMQQLRDEIEKERKLCYKTSKD